MKSNCDLCKNTSPYQAFAHEEENVVKALFFLPGIPKEHIEITLLDKDLTVEVRNAEEEKEDFFEMPLNLKAEYHLKMPCAIDAEKIDTRLENGCLYMTLPKADSAKVKKIPVS